MALRTKLAALSACLVLVGCEVVYHGVGSRVAVIGDSISWLSSDEIIDHFDDSNQIAVTAVIGHTFPPAQVTADAVAATAPSAVIVELGTNDVWRGLPLGETLDQAETMIAKFPDACVVYVTINEHTGNEGLDNDQAALLNDGIAPMVDVVADWDTAANIDPVRFLEPGQGIHPTDEGQLLLANLMFNAVTEC